MTEQEIIEGDKLIAEFMGNIYSKNAEAWGIGNAKIEHKELTIQGKVYKNLVWAERFEKELKYHSSWDWLMPVVNKIESKGFDVFINGLYCRITDCGLTDLEIESGETTSKIEAVWETVVEFIKWYNKEKEVTMK